MAVSPTRRPDNIAGPPEAKVTFGWGIGPMMNLLGLGLSASLLVGSLFTPAQSQTRFAQGNPPCPQRCAIYCDIMENAWTQAPDLIAAAGLHLLKKFEGEGVGEEAARFRTAVYRYTKASFRLSAAPDHGATEIVELDRARMDLIVAALGLRSAIGDAAREGAERRPNAKPGPGASVSEAGRTPPSGF